MEDTYITVQVRSATLYDTVYTFLTYGEIETIGSLAIDPLDNRVLVYEGADEWGVRGEELYHLVNNEGFEDDFVVSDRLPWVLASDFPYVNKEIEDEELSKLMGLPQSFVDFYESTGRTLKEVKVCRFDDERFPTYDNQVVVVHEDICYTAMGAEPRYKSPAELAREAFPDDMVDNLLTGADVVALLREAYVKGYAVAKETYAEYV